MLGQLSTTCSNATELVQWGAPSCSRQQQLLTMASEKVDPIDWPLPPTLHKVVPHELHVLHGANAITRLAAASEALTRVLQMTGQRTAGVATQSTLLLKNFDNMDTDQSQ